MMKVKDSIVVKKILDNSVLLDGSGEFSGFIRTNEMGVYYFNCLRDGLNREDIINKVLNEYNIDKDTVIKDLDDFINRLLSVGILKDE